jgi:hypothetical protein
MSVSIEMLLAVAAAAASSICDQIDRRESSLAQFRYNLVLISIHSADSRIWTHNSWFDWSFKNNF